jgi:hypothetical protein
MAPIDDLSHYEISQLAVAAQPLWDALAQRGWTDAWGGAEFDRVFAETLNFIHSAANLSPVGDV